MADNDRQRRVADVQQKPVRGRNVGLPIAADKNEQRKNKKGQGVPAPRVRKAVPEGRAKIDHEQHLQVEAKHEQLAREDAENLRIEARAEEIAVVKVKAVLGEEVVAKETATGTFKIPEQLQDILLNDGTTIGAKEYAELDRGDPRIIGSGTVTECKHPFMSAWLTLGFPPKAPSFNTRDKPWHHKSDKLSKEAIRHIWGTEKHRSHHHWDCDCAYCSPALRHTPACGGICHCDITAIKTKDEWSVGDLQEPVHMAYTNEGSLHDFFTEVRDSLWWKVLLPIIYIIVLATIAHCSTNQVGYLVGSNSVGINITPTKSLLWTRSHTLTSDIIKQRNAIEHERKELYARIKGHYDDTIARIELEKVYARTDCIERGKPILPCMEDEEDMDDFNFHETREYEVIDNCQQTQELDRMIELNTQWHEKKIAFLEFSTTGEYHAIVDGHVFSHYESDFFYFYAFHILILLIIMKYTIGRHYIDAWLEHESIDQEHEEWLFESYKNDVSKPRNIRVKVLRWINAVEGVRHTSHSTGEVKSKQRRCEVQVTKWIMRYRVDNNDRIVQMENSILDVQIVEIDLSMVEQLLDQRVMAPGNNRDQQRLRIRTKASTMTTHDIPSCAALDNHGEFNTTVQVAEQLARRPTGALNMDF